MVFELFCRCCGTIRDGFEKKEAFHQTCETAASGIRPVFQLQLLILIFAATTVLGRLSSLSAPVMITWRCLLAAFGAFLWAAIRSKGAMRLGFGEIRKLLGVGVLVGLHWLCLFAAVKVANISIALAGLATLSLFTAIADPLINRRRISPLEVLLGLLVVVGILMIAGAEGGHLKGLMLALASALLAAVFMVINKRIVVSGGDPMIMVAWEMVAAAVVCFFAIPIFDPSGITGFWFTDPMDWLWMLILVFGCTVYAHSLANRLLREISAYRFNLAANFEPVYGIIAGAVIFGEYKDLKLTFYGGALMIVLANFFYPLLKRRFGREGG